MDLCFQSLMKSLLFLFSVFSSSFFPPWKDLLTNYDSWVERLSLFTLQRQTCESQWTCNVINVSIVHLIFTLHVVCETTRIWLQWLSKNVCKVAKSFHFILLPKVLKCETIIIFKIQTSGITSLSCSFFVHRQLFSSISNSLLILYNKVNN